MDAHEATIERRAKRAAPILRRQLERLYGGRKDFDLVWSRAMTTVLARAAERNGDLRRLDREREDATNWFVAPDMFGYSTYVDRFGGTVSGVTEHVDHLESLGVRYLHLLALLKAREGDSDGGFAVADYLSVEPRLGSMEDVERLAERLRAGRISLCVDLALNHTADDHEWACRAKAGEEHYRAFYHVLTPEDAANREKDLQQVFPTTAPGNFTDVPEMGGSVWTTFYPFQWDLNWSNPHVFLSILDTMLRLANRGIEAFRLDSIAFLWKQAGTDCRNLPHAHHIVRGLRAALDIAAPGTLLKAEAIVPTAFVPPYFGMDDGEGFERECDLVYNNSLMVAGWVAIAEGSAALPEAVLRASGGLSYGANWLTYARCHDDIGWGSVLADLGGIDAAPIERLKAAARFTEGRGGSWARGEAFQSDGSVLHGSNGTLASLAGVEAAGSDVDERETAYRRIALLNALSIASGGLATTYMGDEVGLLNDWSYADDPDRAHEGRWLHRPLMDWSALDGEAARRISADLAQLRRCRIESGGAGSPATFDSGHGEVLGLRCGTDRVYLNFGTGTVTLADVGSGRDRLGDRSVHGDLELLPWQVAWLGDVA